MNNILLKSMFALTLGVASTSLYAQTESNDQKVQSDQSSQSGQATESNSSTNKATQSGSDKSDSESAGQTAKDSSRRNPLPISPVRTRAPTRTDSKARINRATRTRPPGRAIIRR